MQDGVTLSSFALSDKNETRKYYTYSAGYSGLNSFFQHKIYGVPTRSIKKVTCITLDAVIKKSKIGKVALLKVDVEGAEHLILSGAQESLKAGKIPVIYWESNPMNGQMNMKKCFEILENFGYQHFTLNPLKSELVPWYNENNCLSILPSYLKRISKELKLSVV